MSGILLNRQQSREIDRVAIEQYGFSGLVLMENAGRGVAEVLLEVDASLGKVADVPITILCGKGNNAGDGFVIARHLGIRSVRSRVVLLNSPSELRGDALANYEILRRGDFAIEDLSAATDLAKTLQQCAARSTWLVDAMLGTGATGEPREPYATAIRWMNAQLARRLAVDVPSGLDCDTGKAADPTVRANHTCTFVTAKTGFAQPTAAAYLGQLHVVSIGIPPQLIDEVAN